MASVLCLMWQMECHLDNMADGKAICADDTTELAGSLEDVVPPDASIVMSDLTWTCPLLTFIECGT